MPYTEGVQREIRCKNGSDGQSEFAARRPQGLATGKRESLPKAGRIPRVRPASCLPRFTIHSLHGNYLDGGRERWLKCESTPLLMATALVKSPVIDPRYTRFKLEIRESKIHRRGVFALQRIPANVKVIEYTGEKISRRETKRRGQGSITYLFTLDNYWTIDGAFGGSGAEIINHCCTPNLYTKILKGHILYMSKRVIKPGEELTVDYRFSDKIDRVPCKCGSAGCRGRINVKE